MSDVVEAVPIPGMQITFQSPVGPSGKGMSFVLSADALISEEELRSRVGIVAAVARWADAFEQLRLDQNGLAANRKLLPKARAKRDELLEDRKRYAAEVASKTHFIVPNRRNRVAEVHAAPADIHEIARLDRDISTENGRIFEIEAAITGFEERIPFWKAILRGEEPLDIEDLTPAIAAE